MPGDTCELVSPIEQEWEAKKLLKVQESNSFKAQSSKRLSGKSFYLFVDLSIPFVVIVVVITVVEVESVATGAVVVGAAANDVNVAGVLEVGV